jgi:RNA polymerase sigma-70 factor (ECF subfamily)
MALNVVHRGVSPVDKRSDKQPEPPAGLAEIQTNWGEVNQANQSSVTIAGPARSALVLRYNGAIRRFLGMLIRDPHDADEVAQELVQRLLRGDFSRADPQRGRFRDLLAVAARNLARTFWARKQRQAVLPLEIDVAADAAAPGEAHDEPLIANWRAEVLKLTWAALEVYEKAHRGSLSWTLLRLRTEHPDDDSEQLARRLSEVVGRPVRADAVRQQLHRARHRFAELLLQEIARGLDDPTPERIGEELLELGLLEYVRDFMPEDWNTRGKLRER